MNVDERIDRLEREIWRDRGKSAMYERAVSGLIALLAAQYPGATDLLSQEPELSSLAEAPEQIREAYLTGVREALDGIKAAAAIKPTP